jgi:small subunit ribosomal protein S27e
MKMHVASRTEIQFHIQKSRNNSPSVERTERKRNSDNNAPKTQKNPDHLSKVLVKAINPDGYLKSHRRDLTVSNMSTLDQDILHPSAEEEAQTCKKKTLVPNPHSEFVNLRCNECMDVTLAFSHSNVPIQCSSCGRTLAFPTGGQIRLADNVKERAKVNA